MPPQDPIPTLVSILYGEEAPSAWRSAAERLLRWAGAFDDWLSEFNVVDARHRINAWRTLFGHIQKPPWELDQADIERHASWMDAQGYSPTTIVNELSRISTFYRWCAQRIIDPDCPAGFNPAEKARRPKILAYRGARLLSREDVRSLLSAIQQDPSALGRRDYAFTLARLRLGVSLHSLLQLKWGQIELDSHGVWVRWRTTSRRRRLSADVWQAIQAALQTAGRLSSIRPADYIFAPLSDPLKFPAGSRAEDWLPGRCLNRCTLLGNLKRYGRLVGIPDERLTLSSLRLTAIRLHLDLGASMADMQEFMDSRTEPSSFKFKLGKLPQLPEGTAQFNGDGAVEIGIPPHEGMRFEPGEWLVHGYYARSLPPEAVAAVAAEENPGIGEQIVGLRILSRGLLERQVREPHLAIQLWEAYTLAASREAELLKAEQALANREKPSEWAEELLQSLDRALAAQGEQPVGDQMRGDALGSTPELDAADRRLVEEIAALRLQLRNGFALAMELKETLQYIRLVDLYGSCAVRLARLQKMEQSGGSKLEAFIMEEFNAAVKEIMQGYGFT